MTYRSSPSRYHGGEHTATGRPIMIQLIRLAIFLVVITVTLRLSADMDASNLDVRGLESAARTPKSVLTDESVGLRSNALTGESTELGSATLTEESVGLESASQTRDSVVMCAIVIHEEPYLDEWVDYYSAIGIDKFYIYDNSKNFALQQWGKGRGPNVVVKHFVGLQDGAYRDCVIEYGQKNNHTWIVFFDVDEFLVLKEGYRTVLDLLQRHCPPERCGALSVNWLIFGSANETVYRPIPVTKRFQFHMGMINPHIKSIARTNAINVTGFFHPHFPILLPGKNRLGTDGRKLDGPFNEGLPANAAVLHHYIYKSVSEHVAKRKRGQASTGKANPTLLETAARAAQRDVGTVWNDAAWRQLKNYVPAYTLYDELYPPPPPTQVVVQPRHWTNPG